MPQSETPDTAAGRGMPYESALLEVVKGLHRDPVFLFGIGAGILIVAVLAITTNLAVVLVVAGFFVVALAVGAHQRAQQNRHGANAGGSAVGSNLEDVDVGVVEGQGGGNTRARGWVFFSNAKRSRVGVAGGTPRSESPEGTPQQKPPED